MDAYYQDLHIIDNIKMLFDIIVIPRGSKIKKIEFLTEHVKIYYINETISTKRAKTTLIPYKILYGKGLLID